MRLIDAEALKEKVKQFCRETMSRGFGKTTLSMAWELIGMFVDEIPTIEAKPVVHAHWEEIANGFMVCSHCKESVEENRKYTYCPICGAQMDEVEKE